MKAPVLVILLSAVVGTAFALPRDEVEKQAFRRSAPCPSTGKIRGACPGFEVDHTVALMNGGKDRPGNMQWLAAQDHIAKTKQDVATCKKAYMCKNKRLKKKLPWE